MRISRMYQANTLACGQKITLDQRNIRYLKSVLRLKVGQAFCLFNGQGGEYRAILSSDGNQRYFADLQEYSDGIPEPTCQLTLAQAISRTDHMDFAIQKAVELGVFAIQPVVTHYISQKLTTIRLVQKQQHWQNVAISATEQSGRCVVPAIYPAMALSTWLASCTHTRRFVLHPGATSTLWGSADTVDTLTVLVGPEGGLSDTEVLLAQQHGFHALQLGPRILRTETAATAAITLLQAQFGDLAANAVAIPGSK